jgi:hypothetical protein
MLKKGDMQDKVESGVVDDLADELIRGHGLGLVLRPYEDAATPRAINDRLPMAAE